jgi:hypothetical protein
MKTPIGSYIPFGYGRTCAHAGREMLRDPGTCPYSGSDPCRRRGNPPGACHKVVRRWPCLRRNVAKPALLPIREACFP